MIALGEISVRDSERLGLGIGLRLGLGIGIGLVFGLGDRGWGLW